MATVTEILNRAARVTGLRMSSSERELALMALQNAYARAVMDAEISLASATYQFTSSDSEYDLSTLLGEQPTRLYHVALDYGGDNCPMQQVSFQELLDLREVSDTYGSPGYYATIGFNKIGFYPNPEPGDQVTIWYVDDVPTLVEADPGVGEETTPSKIPVVFQWDVLLPGTVLEMLDKDQRLAESQMWMDRYEKALSRMREHIGQMGGDANRAYSNRGFNRGRFNDRLGRRW